jgi:hypothetical protein
MIAASTSWLLGRSTLEQRSKPTYALTQMVSVRNGSEPWARGFSRIVSLTQMVSTRNGSEPWDRGFSEIVSLNFSFVIPHSLWSLSACSRMEAQYL